MIDLVQVAMSFLWVMMAAALSSVSIHLWRAVQIHLIWRKWMYWLRVALVDVEDSPRYYASRLFLRGGSFSFRSDLQHRVVGRFLPNWRGDLPQWALDELPGCSLFAPGAYKLMRRLRDSPEVNEIIDVISLYRPPSRQGQLMDDARDAALALLESLEGGRRRSDALEEDYFKRNPL